MENDKLEEVNELDDNRFKTQLPQSRIRFFANFK